MSPCWQLFHFFMAKAKNVVSSQGTGTKQVTLPVIARQQMHAVRSVADQVEKDSPGAIHAMHFNFSGKRMQGTIVYNRDRVRGEMPCNRVYQVPARPPPSAIPFTAFVTLGAGVNS